MPKLPERLQNFGDRFFSCFKKQDHQRDAFDRLVGKVDEKASSFFHSKTDEYSSKAGKLIDEWLSGPERKQCKSFLSELKGDIEGCYGEVREAVHDAVGYEPPSKFERFCGRVEQLFDGLFGD